MQRRALLLSALVPVAALSLPRAARAADTEVTIDNFTFSPALVTVSAGTRLIWTNRDDIPHMVVSALRPPAFKSKVLDTDDAFAMVFDTPGTYSYFCGLHPHMQGMVVVT
ncbi:cupredoxin domain-containing protein [Limobrevibacterium gyesilva]|uniref:Cupredoxin family copper-binding protein n=1 Tax=Limobrevibacterium gyesilva TaxID=2991712 RepID=A0AA41YQ01_9PROT|nr:cupredoxin family copper-binding protein [Limobrevibacterium gyesilva]MCW3474503.1 cupredoxin family copper-binding protein [Limobrevibacterium gyesilva]